MKQFLILATIRDPYDKNYSRRVKAGNAGTAVNRAFAQMRKEELKRKKINWIQFRVTSL